MKPIRPIHDKNITNHTRVQDRVHDILNGNVSLGSVVGLGAGASQDRGNLDMTHAGATSLIRQIQIFQLYII